MSTLCLPRADRNFVVYRLGASSAPGISIPYLSACILVQRDALKPVTTGLASLRGEYIQAFNIQFAGTLIAVVPTVVLFLFLQRCFIQGLTMGSGK